MNRHKIIENIVVECQLKVKCRVKCSLMQKSPKVFWSHCIDKLSKQLSNITYNNQSQNVRIVLCVYSLFVICRIFKLIFKKMKKVFGSKKGMKLFIGK